MTSMTDLTSPLRHERNLTKIAGTLQAVAEARFDVVAPQSALSVDETFSLATVTDPTGEPQLTETGVVEPTIESEMTRTAVRQIAGRLRIPQPFLDRLTDPTAPHEHTALAAENVNVLASTDDRKALYRYLRTDDGLLMRSVLSDKFGIFDNDLALRALIEGLGASGLGLGDCDIEGDITPDRLRLRLHVPAIELLVPDLLGDYRMPFSMRDGNDIHARPDADEVPPVIWAGVEIGNSETGNGTFFVQPRAVVAICRNGLVRPIEFKRAHLGARLDEGKIDWSDTTRKNVYELVSSQVADVMRTYLSTGYLSGLADEMREAKGIAIDSPATAIEIVSDKFGLTEAESASVFDCFARGGDSTLLGLGQAVTAAAQLVDDGDRQAEMEQMFWGIVDAPKTFAAVAS